ncbi:MAG: Cys-Gln thioester bond-forming surface protein [Candidatus Krumholzibacteria bacterium]|nr:Cys-Gln thioester bond-forming surface protein [Candidatus Krumholzibacteria bacterium]
MRRLLPIFVSVALLFPLSAFSSILCIPSDLDEIVGDNMVVFHPNLADSIGAVAGALNVLLDCTTPTLVYCLESDIEFCYPAQYEQGPDIASQEIVWILNNYYPAVPGMPSELSTDVQRSAAVQLAIWHFSDGIDITTGGSDPAVFAAANAIIAAALTATPPSTPTSLVLTPAYSTPVMPGTEVTVTATVYDQNGVAMPGVPISYTITHVGSGSGVTDSNGQFPVTWTESEIGYDVITFTVDYTIPIGLRWVFPGCQDLVQATTEDGRITAVWGENQPVSTESSSWGGIKSLYR